MTEDETRRWMLPMVRRGVRGGVVRNLDKLGEDLVMDSCIIARMGWRWEDGDELLDGWSELS